jgi:HK97 family phage major capsid protein
VESLKDLIEQRNKALHDARAILDKADKEKRALSAEEHAHYERFDADVDRLNDKIAERRIKGVSGRQTAPSELRTPSAKETLKIQLRGRELEFKPGTDEHLRGTAEYAEAFAHVISGGNVGRLAMQVSKGPKGGYLAPTQMAAGMIKFLDDNVFMRQLATVQTITQAVSLGAVSYDSDPADADWSAEVLVSDMTPDDTATVGKRELTPHLCSKLVDWSEKLARTVPSFISFLVQRMGYKFAVTEEKAFLSGDGVQQPLGIFVADAAGVPTTRDITAAAATSFTADNLWDMAFNLKDQYRRNAQWVVSREFVKRVRKLKLGDSQYIWMPGLSGQPDTICDRPVNQSEFAPSTFTAEQYVAVLADFKAGYWIVDALDMELKDVSLLLTLKNKGGTKGSKETDGQPVLAEAFTRLKLAA